jgi:Lon protease-like protein
MSRRLPIFPLDVVLFPGTALPLHIFEPRYRRMLADCLEGEGRFGIVPTAPLHDAPPPGTVGSLGGIRAVQELPDGRSHIVVEGETRFLLVRYLEEGTPYHLALVQEFDETPESLPDEDEATAMRLLYTQYRELIRNLSETELDEPELSADPVIASFQVAAGLEADFAVQRTLLETRSTTERVQLLLELLPALVLAADGALRVHQRAPSNGKGGTHTDLHSE